MLVDARTPYAEYRSSFTRADRKFKEAVGEVRYQQLTGREAGPANRDSKTETRVAQRTQKDMDMETFKITGL